MQLGIVGRYDIVNPGTPSRPDGEQLSQLKADLVAGPQSCGFESGMWTAKLMIPHIKKKYGVQYSMNGIYYLLHKIGFSSRKPEAGTPNQPRNPRKNGLKKS